jgi:hypothetical protein
MFSKYLLKMSPYVKQYDTTVLMTTQTLIQVPLNHELNFLVLKNWSYRHFMSLAVWLQYL